MADSEERDVTDRSGRGEPIRSTGGEAIKWSAVVLIVLAILYFLARYVIPLVG